MNSVENSVSLGRAGITQKSLVTPNDFVSHMIEHIAWRMGCSVDIHWGTDDWRGLGVALGQEIAKFPRVRSEAAALGMIDDGSAEVEIRADSAAQAIITGCPQVDLDWFLGSRCEQMTNGQPLVSLLEGLAEGANLEIRVIVGSLEDPHHTWEGIFRAIGIAFYKLTNPDLDNVSLAAPSSETETDNGNAPIANTNQPLVEQGWTTAYVSNEGASLQRKTAESVVGVEVRFGDSGLKRCDIEVADSINIGGVAELLADFANGAGLALEIEFKATRLSSSHVVTEDIGMVLGRALRSIAIQRMTNIGIHGAGSNVDSLTDSPIHIGISMEGRKFCKFMPFDQDYSAFRKSFLVGSTLPNGLYTEDLDDFVDGVAGGMNASIMVHILRQTDPEQGWPMLFEALGTAVAEALSPNPARRNLIPGVKATLA